MIENLPEYDIILDLVGSILLYSTSIVLPVLVYFTVINRKDSSFSSEFQAKVNYYMYNILEKILDTQNNSDQAVQENIDDNEATEFDTGKNLIILLIIH